MAPKKKYEEKIVIKKTKQVVKEAVEIRVSQSKAQTRSKGVEIEETSERKYGVKEEELVRRKIDKEAATTPEWKRNSEKKKRKKKRGEGELGYKRYVYKVMKQVHPELGISSNTMTIMNNMMVDMFERVAEEAARLSMQTGRITLSAREIQGAVKLVLPGELGKHAIAQGNKAVLNHHASASN